MTSALSSVAETLPAELRERIARPPFPEMWLAAFQARLARGERDAVRLYPELLRMVGAQDRLLELALGALGCSLEVARRAVEQTRPLEGLSEEALAEYSLSGLRRYYEARGKRLVIVEDATSGEDAMPGSLQAGKNGPSDESSGGN